MTQYLLMPKMYNMLYTVSFFFPFQCDFLFSLDLSFQRKYKNLVLKRLLLQSYYNLPPP